MNKDVIQISQVEGGVFRRSVVKGKWFISRKNESPLGSVEYLHPDLVWRNSMMKKGHSPRLGESTDDDFVYCNTEQEAKDRLNAYLAKERGETQ